MLTYITCFDGSYLHKRDPYPYITSEQLQYADQLCESSRKNTSFKMIHHHSAKIIIIKKTTPIPIIFPSVPLPLCQCKVQCAVENPPLAPL